MLNINKAIQGLGLSESEVNIYLSSLELGESNISELAKNAGLTRSSCYNGVQKLISLGLMSIYRIGSRKIYRAANPDRLLSLFKEREELIAEVLPKLKSRQHIHDKKPALFTYQGREGFKAVLNDILDRQFPLSAITSIDNALAVLGEDFKEFIEERSKKHLRVRLLTDKTDKTIEMRKKDNAELRVTKFLPSGLPLTTANFIYGDRIAIVSLIAKDPFSIIIEDPAVVGTYANLFEIAWSHGQ